MKWKIIIAGWKTEVANNGATDAVNGKIGCSGYLSDCRYQRKSQSPSTDLRRRAYTLDVDVWGKNLPIESNVDSFIDLVGLRSGSWCRSRGGRSLCRFYTGTFVALSFVHSNSVQLYMSTDDGRKHSHAEREQVLMHNCQAVIKGAWMFVRWRLELSRLLVGVEYWEIEIESWSEEKLRSIWRDEKRTSESWRDLSFFIFMMLGRLGTHNESWTPKIRAMELACVWSWMSHGWKAV